jgi:hypothetical protein
MVFNLFSEMCVGHGYGNGRFRLIIGIN